VKAQNGRDIASREMQAFGYVIRLMGFRLICPAFVASGEVVMDRLSV
jgi:hypothetical protein